MRRVLPLVAAAVVATGAVILNPAAGAPVPAVTFGVPRIADPIHAYGEPDIAVGPTGTVHVSGPQGTGVQRSIWNISVDGGDSYRNVDDLRFNDHQPVDCDQTSACPSKATLGPGGGDTEIYVTRDNQAFYNDLWALACFTAGTTKNDGKSVASNPNGCSQDGLANADRQWMTAFDPSPSDHTISPYTGKTPLVYMAYNGPQVDMTTDGLDYSRSAGQYKNNTGSPWIVDQHTGKVMTITADGNTLQLAVGSPDETGKLDFDYNDIADRDDPPGLLFPTLSQDTDRNIYAVWTEDHNYQVYYTWASAKDGWKKWAPVRQLSKPPAKVNVFSWSTSGGPGMLDAAWYGTPDDVQSPDDQAHQTWYLYFAQVDHANTAHPHEVQVQASPHPMHYNDICLQGTGCIASVGNRNLADFFKIVLDNAGRARIVYADTSNRLMEVDTPEGADHAGAPVDTVVTQSTGLNGWTGAPLAPLESTAAISGVNDPVGDALWQPLGGSTMNAADITKATIEKDGNNLVIKVNLREGRLADVATATASPAAQLVVRWQVKGAGTAGDPIYYAEVEETPGGSAAPVAAAGPARSVDLCSVSACKPNYVVYPGPDGVSRQAVDVGFAGQTYTITVPLSVVGSPDANTLFEEVEAHVAAEPKPAAAPDTKIEKFPDEVPTVVDATRTWNYKLGATGLGDPVAKVAAVQRAGCSVAGSTGGTSAGNDGHLPSCIAGTESGGSAGGGTTGGSSGGRGGSGDDGHLATTGLDPMLPAAAVLLLGTVAILVRRRRRAA